ncbi:ribosome biogenesis protein [Candidatus Woesearchaeota archaeon]|nr:ribosome biogenesis protein [Candidatus Woesearchaeota archaeon]
MYKCEKCGYTLSVACPKCRQKTKEVKVPKFNPEDKYGKYRRQAEE